MNDARFEEGQEKPLRLLAADQEDLTVVSMFSQDAVLCVGDIRWMQKRRQLALLLNRFRWEDARQAQKQGRGFERVRSILQIDDVTAIRSNGISQSDNELVLSLLSVVYHENEEGGQLVLAFAGDGELVISVEAVNVTLTDVTQPYGAPSGKKPSHPV